MNLKLALGLVIVGLVFAVEVSGHCAKCGLEGYDACGCEENAFKAVKPSKPELGGDKVIYKKIKGVEGFKPIGDSCGCTGVKVSPAVFPKQKFDWNEKNSKKVVYAVDSSEFESEFADSDAPKYVHAPHHMHDFEVPEEENNPQVQDNESLVPVDIVSMNIVQDMKRKAATRQTDEKLFYGFTSLPMDKPVLKTKDEVPEENLYTYEKRIVELRPQKQVIKCGDGPDGEVTVTDDAKPTAFLSYGDLGFAPVAGAKPSFIKKSCHHRYHHNKPDSYEDFGSYEYGKKHYKKREESSEEFVIKDESDEVYKVPTKKGVFLKKLGGCDC